MRILLACLSIVVASCWASAEENAPAARTDETYRGDLVPRSGRGTPPFKARGNGPWATRVMLATSTNGLDFARRHFVLSDQAGFPNVVVDHEQRARVYYVDFGNSNVLACAIQADSSLTNWIYRRVTIAGLPQTRMQPVEPTVVTLADGRYRLYYLHAAPTASVYSAISRNGVNFTREEGIRSTDEPRAVFNPCVLKTESEWLLWCGGEEIFAASSRDGLDFPVKGKFRVDTARFMPWSAVVLPAKTGYRLYGSFVGPGEWTGGVSSVFSRDGKTWKREGGIRLSLDGSRYGLESQVSPDSGCAFLPSGTWLMAYVATIPEPRGR